MAIDIDLPKLENIAKAYDTGKYRKPAIEYRLTQAQTQQNSLEAILSKIGKFVFSGTKEAHAQQAQATTQYQRGTPEFYENLAKQAEVISAKKNPKQVVSLLEPFMNDLNNKSSSFFDEYALALHVLKRYDEAEIFYKKAVELNPKNAVAHFNIGVLYMERGKKRLATEHLEMFLELNPNYPHEQRMRAYINANK